MHKEPSLLVAGGLVGITTISGVALMAPWSHATSSDLESTQASVTVSSTCSMTANVTTAHTATLINGQYSSGVGGDYPDGIGSTTISVLCNDPEGYDIYTVGYTNNRVGNTVLTSPALNNTDFDIATGTATSGDTSNWAMKIGLVSGTGQNPPTLTDYFNTNGYVAVPETYTRLAYHTNNTHEAISNSSITTTYAAYISGTQPAGTYSGQVAYMLVHPTDGTIQTDYYSMQNIAQWKSSIRIGQEVTAFDMRDGKSYTVARLCMDATTPANCVNGNTDTNDTYSKIWMTQNLDFTIDTTKTYTHTDTDLGWSTTPYNTGATWSPASTLATVATLTNPTGTTVQNWSGNNNTPHQADLGDIYSYQGTRYNSLAECTETGKTEATCAHYHVGNYYDWPAATANNDAASYTTNYTVASNSICPAGWRLPNGPTDANSDGTADTASDFNTLLKANGITNNLTDYTGTNVNVGYATNGSTNIGLSPLYFARSGYVGGSSLYYFGAVGFYWSSTVQSSGYAYFLYYSSGNLYPAYQYDRSYGWSVRCIAR